MVCRNAYINVIDIDIDDNTMPEYAVVAENLTKVYGEGSLAVHALRGVNLKIKRGDFVAVMGPSGSGKSTLLNLLGALDRPTSGKVYIDGVDIYSLSDDELAEIRAKKIGFVFQMFNLVPRMTVLKNVMLPLIVNGVPAGEREKKAREMLELVGLGDKAHRRPLELSGGEQQRVAIARALVTEPAIVLADEPTGNLDSKTGAEIVQLMKRLNREQEATFVVVTHDPEVAQETQKIFHLRDGVIVKEEEVP